jgi:hypothetical protein
MSTKDPYHKTPKEVNFKDSRHDVTAETVVKPSSESVQVLAPLCRVPEELLVIVFRYMHETRIKEHKDILLQSWQQKSNIYRRTLQLNWPELQTCRRIWTIAKCTPELWSLVPLGCEEYKNGLEWIWLCVKRSESVNLTVHACLQPAQQILDILIQLRPRVKDLYLHVSTERYKYNVIEVEKARDLYTSLMGTGWASLKSINISNIPNAVESEIADMGLVSGSSSLLTSLSLEGQRWNLKRHPDFHHLQHLKIRGLHMESTALLHDWLSNLPELVSLDLHLMPDEHIRVAQVIPFSYMKKLLSVHLRGEPTQLIAILPLLPDPHDELVIHCDTSDTSWDSMETSDQDQTQVVDWAVAYLDRGSLHERHVEYVLSLNQWAEGKPLASESIDFALKPLDTSSSTKQRRLRLYGENADEHILQKLASLVSTLHLTNNGLLKEATTMLTAPQSSVSCIAIMSWRSYWDLSGIGNLTVWPFERHLRRMREAGKPMKILMVDATREEVVRVQKGTCLFREDLYEELITDAHVSFDVS